MAERDRSVTPVPPVTRDQNVTVTRAEEEEEELKSKSSSGGADVGGARGREIARPPAAALITSLDLRRLERAARDAAIDALVAEQVAEMLGHGKPIRDRAAFEADWRKSIADQARAYPGFLAKAARRLQLPEAAALRVAQAERDTERRRAEARRAGRRWCPDPFCEAWTPPNDDDAGTCGWCGRPYPTEDACPES